MIQLEINQKIQTFITTTLGEQDLGDTFIAREEKTENWNGTLSATTKKVLPQNILMATPTVTPATATSPTTFAGAPAGQMWYDAIYSPNHIIYTTRVIDIGGEATFFANVTQNSRGTFSGNMFYGDTVESGGAIMTPTSVNVNNLEPFDFSKIRSTCSKSRSYFSIQN